MSAPRSPALFFGREAELARYLTEMPRVRLCAVYGVSGIGKTAFSLCASERLAEADHAARVYVRRRQGETATTLAVSVLEQLAPSDETWRTRPIEALIEKSELVTYLVGRSDRFFVTLAAREAVPISPIALDHLVIKLGALDAADVDRLWSALESLYGARRRVERRCSSNAPLPIWKPPRIRSVSAHSTRSSGSF